MQPTARLGQDVEPPVDGQDDPVALPVVDDLQRRARLGRRHRLAAAERTDDVVTIADSVVALHSSDPVSVYLGAAARMRTPDLTAIDSALYEDHSLVRHHAMRRTLWVMSPAVLVLAHAACTGALVPTERNRSIRMIEDAGLDTDGGRWLAAAKRDVLAALHRRGEATARQLGLDVPELARPLFPGLGPGDPGRMAAHTRVLLMLGFDGAIVRGRPVGSWINGQYRWAAMDSVLPGGLPAIGAAADPDHARTELVRRLLYAFGPASIADLSWWLGLGLGVIRTALAAIGAVEVLTHSGPGWLLSDDLDPVEEPQPWVALLPGLDPTPMGWKRRSFFLDDSIAPKVFDRNGNAGPTIWVDGRVVGGWVQRQDGRIATELLTDVGDASTRSVADAAARLAELLGGQRFSVRFPSPLSTELRHRS